MHLREAYEAQGVSDQHMPIMTSEKGGRDEEKREGELDEEWKAEIEEWEKRRELVYQSCIPANNPWPQCWASLRLLFERYLNITSQDRIPTSLSI
jgi:hypothetical protein